MWEWETRQFARRHNGLIWRRAALALGVSRHLIRHRVEIGRWTEIRHGVYYLNVTPATWKTELFAATLAAGPRAVASHRSAAVLLGIEGVHGQLIEMIVPFANRPAPSGVIVHRSRRRTPHRFVDSIPVTPPARTLLDLAALLPDRVLERAMSSAFRKRLCTPDDVDRAIGIYGGRGVTGTRRARRVLRIVADDVSGSVSEVDMAGIIRGLPIPTPVAQLRVRLPDGTNAYPDFAWPALMRAVEVDGLETHSSADQLAADLNRQNQLMELGWEIRRWPARTVRREPKRVADELVRFILAPPRTVL